MGSALSWIGEIFQWSGRWIPRLIIVRKTHEGVRFVYGKRVRVMAAGLHVYWPLVTEIEIYPVVRQTLSLPEQTLITADGSVVTVDPVVIYRVRNIELVLSSVWEPEETIRDIVQIAVANLVATKTLESLLASGGQLNQDLLGSARQELRGYGIEVLKAMFSSIAPVTAYKIWGFPASMQIVAPIES